jgi:hypothetical protein
MHSDIVPLSPFTDNNPMYRIISLQNLHWFCIFSCLFGVIVLGVRRYYQKIVKFFSATLLGMSRCRVADD